MFLNISLQRNGQLARFKRGLTNIRERKTLSSVVGSPKPRTVEHELCSQYHVCEVDNTPIANVSVQSLPLSMASTASPENVDDMKSLVNLLDQLQQARAADNFAPDVSTMAAVPCSLLKVCRVGRDSSHSKLQ